MDIYCTFVGVDYTLLQTILTRCLYSLQIQPALLVSPDYLIVANASIYVNKQRSSIDIKVTVAREVFNKAETVYRFLAY